MGRRTPLHIIIGLFGLCAIGLRGGSISEDCFEGKFYRGRGNLNDHRAALQEFHQRLEKEGLANTYEAAHAELALQCIDTALQRHRLLQSGRLKPLPGPAEAAADKCYFDTANKLYYGLEALINSRTNSANAVQAEKIRRLWQNNRR